MGNRDQSYCSTCDSYYFVNDGCNCIDRSDYEKLKAEHMKAKEIIAGLIKHGRESADWKDAEPYYEFEAMGKALLEIDS